MSDITVYRGEDRRINFDVTQNDDPVDLSQATVSLEVYANNYSDSPVINQESTQGDSDGNVPFDLTDQETDLEPGTYRFIVFVTTNNGNKYQAENGRINLERTAEPR